MKNKIAKLLGVVLAAVTVVSLFAFALPAGAATTPQTWTKTSLPGAAGYVMPQNDTALAAFNIVATGPLAEAADGTLYVYVQTSKAAPLNYSLLKSTNGGRSWAISGTVGQPTAAVSAITTFGTSLVYYTQGTAVWRSMDAGVTFTNITSSPFAINAIDVATLGTRNLVALGTTGGAYYFDEADPFYTVTQIATPALATNVLAVAFSPSFATDRGLAAVDSTGAINFIVFGGQWNATIAAASVGTITSAVIRYTSDWNITPASNFSNFYVGTSKGVYAFTGGHVPTASATLLLTTSTSPFTANVASMDLTGSGAAVTIVAGLNNTSKGNVIISTNSGASWSTPSKLIGPVTGTTWVALAKDYSTSGKIFALVGGAVSTNNQSGFSYSVDKGTSFNQVSLISDSVSQINEIAASGNTTFVSTSWTAGSNPSYTPAVTAGTFTITAGSHTVTDVAAVPASTLQITSSGSGNVILGLNTGSYSVVATAPATWSSSTQIITFTGAGQIAVVTATSNNTVFSVTGAAAGGGFVLSSGASTGLSPDWQFSLTSAAAAAVTHQETNSVVTLTGLPTATAVSIVTTAAVVTSPTSAVITFSGVNTTAQTAVVTCAAAANFSITATNTSGDLPTYTGALTSATGTLSTPAGGFGSVTFIAPQAAVAAAGTKCDSIWRWDVVNSTWDRVYMGYWTALTFSPYSVVGVAQMVRVSSKFATDNTVFIAAPGGVVLTSSANAGQTWKAQASNVGSTTGSNDTIDSLLVIDGSTQYVGSHNLGSSLVIKTASAGVGTILSPAWTEVTLKSLVPATLTGAVTEISLASNGDLAAVVTNAANTYVLKSADAGLTWKALADPNDTTGATDAVLGASAGGAFVDFAADYATTGNMFVTLNAGGVYRYSSVATAVAAPATNVSPAAVSGWLRVDNAAYDANGAVGMGTGEFVAAGGPGSTAEGSGMVYATDTASAQGVSRIRGITTQAENLAAPTGIVFTGLWGTSSAVGNVQLWTADNTSTLKALYTYIDNLGVAGTGVTIAPATLGSTTAVVSFNTLPTATGYVAYVNTTLQKNLYSAANTALVIPGAITISTDGKTGTFTVTGLLANTMYNVSVWANAPVSSFMFNSAFTTNPTVPTLATGLTPMPGAQNVMTMPTFQWNPVTGATGYELWLDTKPGDINGLSTVTATKYTSSTNAFAVPAALANNTVYYWQVRALTTTGYSAWNGTWSFTTVLVVIPPVTVTSNPVPTIILTATSNPVPTIVINNPPVVTVTQAAAAPAITVTQPSYTLVTPTAETPSYIWIIVGVGALLTLAVIILIIRTRRVV